MEGRAPNRSDIHLPMEEEARIEAETRGHFEGMAPKRHSKPQRSEYSSSYLDANSSTTSHLTPEYVEFRRLEGHHEEKLVYNSAGQAGVEEFVETDYYKDLNRVDKQHHTTGTGFIKAENKKGNYYEEEVAADQEDCRDSTRASCFINGSCHGNPATNDWIPAPPNSSVKAADFVSGKPSRSDDI